jgi:DNA-binding LacI/PurR family transcriptional regulator
LQEGVLASFPGKGYYVKRVGSSKTYRIFLLFNKLSAHKKIIYDSLVRHLEKRASLDFFIYDNDFDLFKKLICEKAAHHGSYSHFVIMPFFNEGGEQAAELINSLPKEKLILLDKTIPGITGDYGTIYEPFEKDIYGALDHVRPQLEKYLTLKMIFPENSYQSPEILAGFQRFCKDFSFDFRIVHNIETEPIAKGEVFIDMTETDLVTLIERINELQLVIGSQVGIISYNDTPLKRVLLNGITTISTDFQKMGEFTAQMILSRTHGQVEVPFHVMLRSSL